MTAETENEVGISKIPGKNTKGCGWVCTLHNLTKTDEEYLADFQKIEGVKYFKGQREKGEKTGKEHIQFFIDFETAVYFSTVQKLLPPTTHIEQRRSKRKIDAVNYCSKEETRIGKVMQFGVFTEDRHNGNTVSFFERLHSGAVNMDLQREFPTLYAQYGVDKIEKFRQDKLKDEYGKKFRSVTVTYIYGAPRTGKTTHIYETYPIDEICRVDNYIKGTFEGYNHQKILVLDEFTGKIDLPFLNNLLDKFPVQLPARFANRTACFEQVFIISNLPLNRLYVEQQTAMPEVYKAFTERIKNIIRFTALGVWHYELKDGKSVPPPKQLKLSDLKPLSAEESDELPF